MIENINNLDDSEKQVFGFQGNKHKFSDNYNLTSNVELLVNNHSNAKRATESTPA